MKTLLNTINKYSKLSEKSWEDFKRILSVKEYVNGTCISIMGQRPSKIFFLINGYARGYSISEKGKTYNRALFEPLDFMASLSALIKQEKANFAIECLSDCKLIEANWTDFLNLANSNDEIGLFYRKVLEERFIKLELSNTQLVTLTATERYLELKNRCPSIENNISQFHIASFIGVSPIQLSRIRKKLYSS